MRISMKTLMKHNVNNIITFKKSKFIVSFSNKQVQYNCGIMSTEKSHKDKHYNLNS